MRKQEKLQKNPLLMNRDVSSHFFKFLLQRLNKIFANKNFWRSMFFVGLTIQSSIYFFVDTIMLKFLIIRKIIDTVYTARQNNRLIHSFDWFYHSPSDFWSIDHCYNANRGCSTDTRLTSYEWVTDSPLKLFFLRTSRRFVLKEASGYLVTDSPQSNFWAPFYQTSNKELFSILTRLLFLFWRFIFYSVSTQLLLT